MKLTERKILDILKYNKVKPKRNKDGNLLYVITKKDMFFERIHTDILELCKSGKTTVDGIVMAKFQFDKGDIMIFLEVNYGNIR